MQVVILAGGRGTRLSEETTIIPKPMVRIGDIPILLHIMNHYATYGHTKFLIALGYKGEVVKDFFTNFTSNFGNIKIKTSNRTILDLNEKRPDWEITLINTGLDTATGGRLKKLKDQLDDTFLCTYGDGLSDVNINHLLDFHHKGSKVATVTAVKPPARFGALTIENHLVTNFQEKITSENEWINGGFFVFKKSILELIDNWDMPLEDEPLRTLAHNKQLAAYQHKGFWQPMDTLRDKNYLEDLWNQGKALWATEQRDHVDL